MSALVMVASVLALVPGAMFLLNLALYRRAPRRTESGGAHAPVSVLIPARNEGPTIGAASHSSR